MFHGWQQLKEADRDLPKIIRKAGPHYVIFQTDEDNLLELKTVIEPEFKVSQIAKGMPQWHAIVRLKMYGNNGDVIPAFMAKGLGKTEDLFDYYDNNDLYNICAKHLGRPKKEVMDEIFRYKMGGEFSMADLGKEANADGEGDIEEVPVQMEEDEEDKRIIRRKMEHEVNKFIENQIANGEEPDYELILHMEELLEGDNNE
jgi:hypothetical protein